MNEREIFAEILQRPAGERAAFLDVACAGDAALRERIEELLREQEQLGSFLEGTPVALALDETRPASGAVQLGQTIGPYKLLQQIGEGGMGAVYMAEQHEPVQRRVALKIIKAGMDTRQVIARFEAERQALAMMDHPNIAKVLDAGTTASGRPFFVMELVKGVPITQYCDQQHLPLRERLELFIPVCQAIQHAHQKGIIHRDLKPSNVLVALYDGRPVPKVIDFGVAKATSQRLTEKTMFTEFGQIVGTLEYMSPEQAELSQLDIDTRSDVYSLGVLLYELLTGTTPFEKQRLRTAAFDEILRMIREEEPPRPSTRLSTTEQLPSIAANRSTPPAKLSGLMRGELDWIVMKALEKDRGRRYETANGLARDVERYLHDEPVQACPPSALYLLRKHVNRHRGLVAGGAIVVLALLLGAIGTTAGLVRAAWERSAKETATRNAEQSDKLAKAATKAEGEAKAALARATVAERDEQVATHLSRARAFRTSGREGQRLRCLDELAAAARLGPPPEMQMELRNEAIACLALWDVGRGANSGAAAPRTNTINAAAKQAVIKGQDVVISTATGTVLQTLQHPDLVLRFEWRPDQRFIATLSDDMNVYIWHIDSGELISVVSGHNAYGLKFSPSGEVLIIHSYDGMCRLWDAIRGQLLLTVKGSLPGEFTGDERFLVSGQSAIEIFGNRECRLLRHGEMGNRGRVTRGPPAVYHLEFSRDSQLLATAATDGVRVWDLSRGGLEIAYLPDETGLGVAFLNGGDLCTSNLSSLGRWKFAASSPDGAREHWGTRETLVSALPGKTIRGVIVATPNQRFVATVEQEGVVRNSPVGSTGNVVLVHLDDLAKAQRFGPQEKCWYTDISPDGQWVAASGWSWAPPVPAQIFQVDSGVRAGIISDNSYATLRFSSDGRWLLCGGQNRYDLRQAGTWQVVKSVERRSHLPGSGDFSPDGKYAAVCPNEEEVIIGRLADYQPVATLRPPDGQILSIVLRFSPNGRYLATNTSYGRVFLWDLPALRQSLTEIGLDWSDSPTPASENDTPVRTVPSRQMP